MTHSFNDGAAYEEMMGTWSRLAAIPFIDWLAPEAGRKWLDVGCGNGAFSETIASLCDPASIDGVDPSEGQLAYARSRSIRAPAQFHQGGAHELAFADAVFDAATMALVIFFVPDPLRGVREMRRVVHPGGLVAAYTWDTVRGGFPLYAMQDEMERSGVPVVHPVSSDWSRMEAQRELWTHAGLVDIETREIIVQRSFASFDHYWQVAMKSNVANQVARLKQEDLPAFKQSLSQRLATDRAGRVTVSARANAIKGRVPG